MRYDSLTKEMEEIEKIIFLNKRILSTLTGLDVSLFKQALHKDLTIEIYTFWENYTKKLIYSCYSDYKKILIDKNFLINFF